MKRNLKVMQRTALILWLVVIWQVVNAQQLDKLGKIDENKIPTLPEYRVEQVNGEYKVFKDSLVFDGNSFYNIPDGFITSLEVFDGNKDYIKHYDGDGNLLVTILSDRIINLKVSEDGNKLAFNNSENIIFIHMNSYEIDTLVDSYVYEFVQGNQFIYYNPEDQSVHFENMVIALEEYPNQFIDFKEKLFVITKNNIFELQGNRLFSRYKFRGKFFDAKIIDGEFFFVDKEEKRKSESFSLYKTTDFDKILLVDRLDDLNR